MQSRRRLVVEWFSGLMLDKLHQPRNLAKGDEWHKDSLGLLLSRLKEELGELEAELSRDHIDRSAVVSETVDVANFAMMLADAVTGSLPG